MKAYKKRHGGFIITNTHLTLKHLEIAFWAVAVGVILVGVVWYYTNIVRVRACIYAPSEQARIDMGCNRWIN